MSSSSNATNSNKVVVPTDVGVVNTTHVDPSVSHEGDTTRTVQFGALRAVAQGRATKRDYGDYNASTETVSAEAHVEDTTSPPAAKKPAAAESSHDGSETRRVYAHPTIDIDLKHADDPQYAAALAPHIYAFLRHLERMVLPDDGEPLKPAKKYRQLKETRTKCINALYHLNNHFKNIRVIQVPTDTIQLAIYYLDRFLERYHDEKDIPIPLISATALFLASKYEDVEPIDIDTAFKYQLFGRDVYEQDMLELEIKFQEVLHILTGPTANAFAMRYMQAVDMEVNISAVHTARYLCALGVAHFGLSGTYYSKIAAAAAFIAYNKYSYFNNPAVAGQSSTGVISSIQFPEALADHCQYTPKDLAPVIVELLSLAIEVEAQAKAVPPELLRHRLPIDVYLYYQKAHVTATCVLPSFSAFIQSAMAEDCVACDDKETDNHSKDASNGTDQSTDKNATEQEASTN